VLGIFFITNDRPDDDDDDAHADTVDFLWYDALLAAKCDDPTAVAVTGLVVMEPVDRITFEPPRRPSRRRSSSSPRRAALARRLLGRRPTSSEEDRRRALELRSATPNFAIRELPGS